MLKYICFWKLKDDTSEEDTKLVPRHLEELPRRVGHVRAFTWGETISPGAGAFTHCFTADFDDMEGLTGYLEHPERLAVEKRVAPYVERSTATYYETA